MKEKFIAYQESLIPKIQIPNDFNLDSISTVAGIDLAYWSEGGKEYAVCCIVVLDSKTLKVIETKHLKGEVTIPYIPSCLAFREIPLIKETLRLIEIKIDLIIVDGNGYYHPRHMGCATQLGIDLSIPTVGVAKNFYKIEGAFYEEPLEEAGSYSNITVNGEVWGRVVRTHKNVHPVYVSIGNLIDLNSATSLIMQLVTKESSVPVPTRLADTETHKWRAYYKSGEDKNVIKGFHQL